MSRKRLGGIDPSRARDARTSAEESARSKRKSALGSSPPIAQVAASVSETIGSEVVELKRENKELSEKGAAFDAALREGRVVEALNLEEIDPLAISRDRRQLHKDGEDWAALKASLLARGQQVPVEVTRTPGGAGYDLVSGFRRWSALAELYAETGDQSFSRVLAFVREIPDTVPKIVAMIEENEIRQNISFFERGRVCALAVADGYFGDVDAAVNGLFESSNRNRRYKIRCFVTVYEEIGSLLDYPEEIGERLGIALAKALREGRGQALIDYLENRDTKFETSAEELSLLGDFVGGTGTFAKLQSQSNSKPILLIRTWANAGGGSIEAKSQKGKVTLVLKGVPDVNEEELEALVNQLGKARD